MYFSDKYILLKSSWNVSLQGAESSKSFEGNSSSSKSRQLLIFSKTTLKSDPRWLWTIRSLCVNLTQALKWLRQLEIPFIWLTLLQKHFYCCRDYKDNIAAIALQSGISKGGILAQHLGEKVQNFEEPHVFCFWFIAIPAWSCPPIPSDTSVDNSIAASPFCFALYPLAFVTSYVWSTGQGSESH